MFFAEGKKSVVFAFELSSFAGAPGRKRTNYPVEASLKASLITCRVASFSFLELFIGVFAFSGDTSRFSPL